MCFIVAHFDVHHLCNFLCTVFSGCSDLNRYAYSEEANEDFHKDDSTLTLVKPSPTPSKEFFSAPEDKPVQASNGAANDGLEEEKKE